MTLTAYYQGREVWTAEGPTWPPGLELEPIGAGWTYSLNGELPLGRDAVTLRIWTQ